MGNNYYNEYFYKKDRKTSAIETLIIINVVIFILTYLPDYLRISRAPLNFITILFALNINFPNNIPSVNNGAYWQILTSMFLHGNLFHILFNMYGLYIFGKPINKMWGDLKFYLFYLMCGICANILSFIFFYLTKFNPVSLIGASGAVYAILLAFAAYFPDTKLLLFFFIPMKVKWAILLFTAIEVFSQISKSSSNIAHITHLFGFLFAYLFLIIFFHIDPIKNMFFKNDNIY